MGRQDTKRYQVTRLSVTRSYWVILGHTRSAKQQLGISCGRDEFQHRFPESLGMPWAHWFPKFPTRPCRKTPFRNSPYFGHGSSLLAGISKSIHERKWINDDKWLWIKRYLGTPKIAHKWMSIHFTSENHGLRPLPMYPHLCSVKSNRCFCGPNPNS